MKYVLFNPLANNKRGETDARTWANAYGAADAVFQSVIGLDYKKFFDDLKEDDEVTLCGGDGTLNYFVNEIYGYDFKMPLYYAKCGTGNDFYKDVEAYEKNGRIDLKPFIVNLPLVTVNGIKKRFINGIGYGVDGDTCLMGDKVREKDPGAAIDYSKIAIGLLLGTYKDLEGHKHAFDPKNAVVVADGKEYKFSNVWLASAMHGRYYGGGMMAAPSQDRLNNGGKCTVMTYSSKGRLITLLRFPAFSGGKHDGKKYLKPVTGKHVTVTFDKPCALQIDGDTVKNVTTYSVDYDE